MTGDIAEHAGRRGRSVPAQADRGIDGEAGPALEARLLLGGGLQRLGRAQPQAAGAHPGRARRRGCRSPDRSSWARSPGLICWPRRAKYNVFAVRWPAFGDVTGEGLLLEPGDRLGVADVIVIPDADQTPEQLVGLVPGVPAESQVARRLAESGCRVIVPALIDRTVAPRNGRAKLTNREFLYRPAFELGRHLIGYEVQKVLALVDWLSKEAGSDAKARIGIFGYGEGGAIALYAAALDPRIDAVCVSGYFDDRNARLDPADRPQRLRPARPVRRRRAGQPGRAPAARSSRRPRAPSSSTRPGRGEAPGKLDDPEPGDRQGRGRPRPQRSSPGSSRPPRIELVVSGPDGTGPFGTDEALSKLLAALDSEAKLADPAADEALQPTRARSRRESLQARQARQLHELDRHNQQLLVESPYVRQKFMEKLDTTSPEAYAKTVEPYREIFATEVIGRFDLEPLLPPNVRSRKVYDEPKYTGYEVVMDVLPDVIAYGILLLPKDIKDGEKRPVVVCQHGLEGRPRDVADPKVNNPAYNQFAIRLAERGFITFAPQNLYIFEDRFRTLQRKANPLGKTLFSIIVPQHQQITDWLKTLPQVDPARIAFYGLSYGGKSAMRIPAAGEELLPVDLLGRLQRVGVEERLQPQPLQLRLERRVRDLRVRPGLHLQLRRDGRPDRPPAVHGRARPLRRRGPRRDGRLRVRQGVQPLQRPPRPRRPLQDRVLRRPAHDQRQGDVQVLARAIEVAGGKVRWHASGGSPLLERLLGPGADALAPGTRSLRSSSRSQCSTSSGRIGKNPLASTG